MTRSLPARVKRKLEVQPIKDVISMRALPSLNSQECSPQFERLNIEHYIYNRLSIRANRHDKHINEVFTFPRNRNFLMQISACDYVSRVALFTREICNVSMLFRGKVPCSQQSGFPRVHFRCIQLDSRHQALVTLGINLFKAFTT